MRPVTAPYVNLNGSTRESLIEERVGAAHRTWIARPSLDEPGTWVVVDQWDGTFAARFPTWEAAIEEAWARNWNERHADKFLLHGE